MHICVLNVKASPTSCLSILSSMQLASEIVLTALVAAATDNWASIPLPLYSWEYGIYSAEKFLSREKI